MTTTLSTADAAPPKTSALLADLDQTEADLRAAVLDARTRLSELPLGDPGRTLIRGEIASLEADIAELASHRAALDPHLARERADARYQQELQLYRQAVEMLAERDRLRARHAAICTRSFERHEWRAQALDQAMRHLLQGWGDTIRGHQNLDLVTLSAHRPQPPEHMHNGILIGLPPGTPIAENAAEAGAVDADASEDLLTLEMETIDE